MKKRIFLGIRISDKLKNKIAEFRQKYKNLPVRWMREENFHLTIIAPMELDDNEMVEMIEKLKKIEDEFGPIEIEFDKICFGPNLRRPRLIWVESKPNQKLVKLKNKITQILGLRIESRLSRPHLTIARFKPRDLVKINKPISWQEEADSFAIVQSKCLENGAVYINLAEIKL